MAHIAVLGAGSWGTALAVLLCRNGHSVTLWSHRKEHADSMRKTGINEKSFPGIRLPETLTYTSDIEEAVSGPSGDGGEGGDLSEERAADLLRFQGDRGGDASDSVRYPGGDSAGQCYQCSERSFPCGGGHRRSADGGGGGIC